MTHCCRAGNPQLFVPLTSAAVTKIFLKWYSGKNKAGVLREHVWGRHAYNHARAINNLIVMLHGEAFC